ncbi:Rdx family-domain-containing protein [Astrocystis sublimbata]|nr:Rdx family-domain-containing protein [Astrocystis sublimbata]
MAETGPSVTDQPPASSISREANGSSPSPLPRVTIRFCTQCKWMLRAAYFAQELLSTFSTSLGEVALQPATGGVFVVKIYHAGLTSTATSTDDPPAPAVQHRILWDRKVDGGFPETKELKRRVRDVIEPERNLGHIDRDYYPKAKPPPPPPPPPETQAAAQTQQQTSRDHCEDCQ